MKKTPDHIEFYKQLKSEPEDTRVHPLDEFAKIEQKFTTPFLESDTQLSEKMREDLIKVLEIKEQALTELKETNPDFYGMANAKGWGVRQADELKLEGRCFGNVQVPGARTYPHYHQDVNGVLEHYLTVGNNDLDVDIEKSPRHARHSILFQDPRPGISYPYWEKLAAYYPRVGLTIIHPNYVWHETNPWLGEGKRVCIVVNFRIVSHGYNELHKPLRS